MADRISRRELFTRQILRAFRESDGAEDRRNESLEAYFRSPLHSYPLLQEMPWDLLCDEARARGIPVEGRSKNDIARDLFLKFSRTT